MNALKNSKKKTNITSKPMWYRIYHLLKKPLFILSLLPISGGSCRFTPTCSLYCKQALKKHGAIKGGWYCISRVFRCNPLFPPGHDPIP